MTSPRSKYVNYTVLTDVAPPDGIIITISEKMLKEKGYRNWLRNFLDAMRREDWIYSMRQGARPRLADNIQYVYLCIGGKVRFRAFFAGTSGPCWKKFHDGKQMFARAWVELAGPVERPPRGREPKMKGFRGFRYTQKLF
jgi:hypothetical protein